MIHVYQSVNRIIYPPLAGDKGLFVRDGLANDPDVLIMDEPTRGIDVGAKYEIYCIIGDLAKQGKSIIMISSEMEELIGMADRIMVMCDGKVTGIIEGDEINDETIMELATRFDTEEEKYA